MFLKYLPSIYGDSRAVLDWPEAWSNTIKNNEVKVINSTKIVRKRYLEEQLHRHIMALGRCIDDLFGQVIKDLEDLRSRQKTKDPLIEE